MTIVVDNSNYTGTGNTTITFPPNAMTATVIKMRDEQKKQSSKGKKSFLEDKNIRKESSSTGPDNLNLY